MRRRGAIFERGGRSAARTAAIGACIAVLAALVLLAARRDAGAGHAGDGWPGHAHTEGASETLSVAALPPLVLALVLGASIALGASIVLSRRTRLRSAWRTSSVALSLLLSVSAVESAVHSVHHLSDADAAAGCVVASVSQHVAGAGDVPVLDLRPEPVVRAAPAVAADHIAPVEPLRPFEGRAPPPPRSA